jgi:5-formyltetrahydrofolate cyclo-ligase
MRYHRRMPSETVAPALPTGGALREAKRVLRARVVAARDALDAGTRDEAAAVIARRIEALPSFGAARSILLTLPFRTEWDTRPLIAAALAAGRSVAAPRVDESARMLELRAIADIARDLVPGFRGILEPRLHCRVVSPATIDWVLVPGVAFDAAGRRLGYGGGYYDRLLPLLAPGAPRIAGAYEAQIVDHVPAAPHDLRVDAVVTERRTLVAT